MRRCALFAAIQKVLECISPANDGGIGAEAFELLIGKPPSFGITAGLPAATIERELEKQLALGNPVTAAGAPPNSPLYASHEYSVL